MFPFFFCGFFMSDDDVILLNSANDNVDDDMILPFQLESSNLRGRIVRLGPVIREILDPHAYPVPVAQLVAETSGMALLLGGMLKYEGIFTLQAQGDGPVRLLVADLTTSGDLRAYAGFDAERLSSFLGDSGEQVVGLRATDRPLDLENLVGHGYLAFTVDQGEHTERYQGIVELKGPNLSACVRHYFEQSEQIGTVILVAAGQTGEGWRAGGLMLQRLPLPEDQKTPEAQAQAEEDWGRARALLETCSTEELISPRLDASSLLFRLFHEEGVRVYNPLKLRKGCRCSSDRLSGILSAMPPDDLDHMAELDGQITMRCEFCAKDFRFDRAALGTGTIFHQEKGEDS